MRLLNKIGSVLFILILGLITLSAMRLQASSGMRNQHEQIAREWEERKARLRVEDIKIESYARGLSIIKLERKDDLLHISLRNDYPKTITRYTIGIGSMITGAEMLNGDDSILRHPSEEWLEKTPIQPDTDTLGIRLLAVIFHDRTTDGDPVFVNRIVLERLGMKMQRERALDLVRNVLAAKDGYQRSSVIRDWESQLAPLPSEEMEKLSSDVRLGILMERNRILRQITVIRDFHEAAIAIGGSDAAASRSKRAELDGRLTTILQQYEVTIPRL